MGAHTFPMGICPKVNIIARLEFELVYYDSAVQRFTHYITRIPPEILVKSPKSLFTCWWYVLYKRRITRLQEQTGDAVGTGGNNIFIIIRIKVVRRKDYELFQRSLIFSVQESQTLTQESSRLRS